MRKARIKKRITIIVAVCLVLLVGAFVADHFLSKSYFSEIKYKELMKKVDDKESFVFVISQTTCSHCMDYKPKIARVAKKYKINIYYIEFDLLTEKQQKKVKEHFNFDGTPQTVFVIEGTEPTVATRINGDASEDKIIKKLKSNGFIK